MKTYPAIYEGSLDLRGCDLTGVTLPQHAADQFVVDVLADDGEYELVVVRIGSDWRYVAGCRNFDRTAALAHWDRPDRRAQMFRAAILADEPGERLNANGSRDLTDLVTEVAPNEYEVEF